MGFFSDCRYCLVGGLRRFGLRATLRGIARQRRYEDQILLSKYVVVSVVVAIATTAATAASRSNMVTTATTLLYLQGSSRSYCDSYDISIETTAAITVATTTAAAVSIKTATTLLCTRYGSHVNGFGCFEV